jgi:hypothetical protein
VWHDLARTQLFRTAPHSTTETKQNETKRNADHQGEHLTF